MKVLTDFDLSNYLGVFLDEVDEQLQILDTEILKLEKQPTNMETIVNIFRAAHTLKGSSASMGFEKMKEFTHHLENVFQQIREHQLEVTHELINIILECIDLIRVLKNAIINNSLDQIDTGVYIEKLQQLTMSKQDKQDSLLSQSRTSRQIELDEYQKALISKGMLLGYHALEIYVRLYQDSVMKNARAVLVHNQLHEAGEIVATSPDIKTMENDEHLEGTLFFVILTMQTKEEIQEVLTHIADIEAIHILQITETDVMASKALQDNRQEEGLLSATYVNGNSAIHDKAKVASTVRVDVDKLEHLMNLVGELVIDQTRLIDVRGRLADKDIRDEAEFEILDEVTNHLGRVVAELQEGMMKTRMLPIEQLFNRFPRMVRDTSIKANKEIEFVMEGKETELDRTLIEEVSDPIIHLLRNAIDHGIESSDVRLSKGKSPVGKVVLKASHEENHIVISITDDGKGIDPNQIRRTAIEKGIISEEEARKLSDKDAVFLIFMSGISTAEKITDISGRGVGMDIVKSHIERLNGIIEIDSSIDVGTTFTIKLPLTLAIIRSLLIKLGNKTFAIPLVNVLEIIRLEQADIQVVNNQEVGMVRGRVLPLVRMKERLGISDGTEITNEAKREFVIVIGIAEKRIGIIADQLIGNQEIVIKSLGSYIGSPPFISGATIMGDGSVALILDVSSIVRECGIEERDYSSGEHVEAGNVETQLVTFKLDEEEYGIEIQRAKDIITIPTITKVMNTPEDLLGIIDLRGNMLPVIDLQRKFNLKGSKRTSKSRIIIVENGEQDVGFLVDEVTQVLKISDALIEQPKAEHHYNAAGLIKGIGKLNERIVLILEFDELLKGFNTESCKEITI